VTIKLLEIYQEIDNYAGNFGDPIVGLIGNPFENLVDDRHEFADAEELGISIIIWITSAIDNSTYKATERTFRRQIEKVVSSGLLEDAPVILSAVSAFLSSEELYEEKCRNVYELIVQPALLDE